MACGEARRLRGGPLRSRCESGWLCGVCSDDVVVCGDELRAVHGKPLELCGPQRRYATSHGEVSGFGHLLDEVELDESGEDAGAAPGTHTEGTGELWPCQFDRRGGVGGEVFVAATPHEPCPGPTNWWRIEVAHISSDAIGCQGSGPGGGGGLCWLLVVSGVVGWRLLGVFVAGPCTRTCMLIDSFI